jgi:hypothetical protein
MMTNITKTEAYNRVMEGVPNYATSDPLTVFFYLLCRDHLPEADVVELLRDVEIAKAAETAILSNGYLAQFAEHCANKLRGETP